MKTPQALYYAADKALYQAKHSGRDCYSVYRDADAPPLHGKESA
jgi:PleD family two-component response regulator